MFKPIIPVIEDAWSHAFDKAEHLSTVHAHQGKNHLDIEVADKASENDSSKPQKTIKVEDQFTSHICTPVYKFICSLKKENLPYAPLQGCQITAVFISVQAPPPKFSC
ncbi:MAG: hypothetical protein ACTHMD_18165 [Flavisolibacter sp.]